MLPATLISRSCCSCSVSGHWPMQRAMATFLILASRPLSSGLPATSGGFRNLLNLLIRGGCPPRGNWPCFRAAPLCHLCLSFSRSWGDPWHTCHPLGFSFPEARRRSSLLSDLATPLGFLSCSPLAQGGDEWWQDPGPFLSDRTAFISLSSARPAGLHWVWE